MAEATLQSITSSLKAEGSLSRKISTDSIKSLTSINSSVQELQNINTSGFLDIIQLFEKMFEDMKESNARLLNKLALKDPAKSSVASSPAATAAATPSNDSGGGGGGGLGAPIALLAALAIEAAGLDSLIKAIRLPETFKTIKSFINGISDFGKSILNFDYKSLLPKISFDDAKLDDLKKSVLKPFESIVDGVKAKLSGPLSVLDDIKSGITTWFDGVKTNISTKFSGPLSVLDDIKSGITTWFDGVKTNISTKFSGALTVLDDIKSSVTSWFDGIKTNITTKFTDIATKIDDVKTGITNTFDTISTKVKSLIPDTPKWITDITTSVDDFGKKIFGFIDSIKIELPSFLKDVKIPGLSMIKEFLFGAESATDAAKAGGGIMGLFSGLGRAVDALIAPIRPIVVMFKAGARSIPIIGQLLTLFDFIGGFMKGFEGETEFDEDGEVIKKASDRSFLDKVLEGIEGGLLGVVKGITEGIDMLLLGIPKWILEQLGFEKTAAALGKIWDETGGITGLVDPIWKLFKDIPQIIMNLIPSANDIQNFLIKQLLGIPGGETILSMLGAPKEMLEAAKLAKSVAEAETSLKEKQDAYAKQKAVVAKQLNTAQSEADAEKKRIDERYEKQKQVLLARRASAPEKGTWRTTGKDDIDKELEELEKEKNQAKQKQDTALEEQRKDINAKQLKAQADIKAAEANVVKTKEEQSASLKALGMEERKFTPVQAVPPDMREIPTGTEEKGSAPPVVVTDAKTVNNTTYNIDNSYSASTVNTASGQRSTSPNGS